MPATPKKTVSRADIAKIYAGLNDAGLGGFRITSLHLSPVPAAAGAAAADPDNACHAQQLPNGHWVIVCD
jgi:hypothetical protein